MARLRAPGDHRGDAQRAGAPLVAYGTVGALNLFAATRGLRSCRPGQSGAPASLAGSPFRPHTRTKTRNAGPTISTLPYPPER